MRAKLPGLKRLRLSNAIALSLLASGGVSAAQFVVQTNGDTGMGVATLVNGNTYTIDTLRSAIEQAESGAFPGPDSISFDPTLTQGGAIAISLTAIGDVFGDSDSAFGINSDITIEGANLAADIVLDAGNLRHFQVNNAGSLRIDRLTLSGGLTPNSSSGRGGAVMVDSGGDLVLNDSAVYGNVANTGGGLHVGYGATASVSRSVFRSNSTTGTMGNGTGGAIFVGGTIQLSDSTLDGNIANYSGGGIFVTGSASIAATTVSSNTGITGGGGVGLNNVGVLDLVNSTVSGNRTPAVGGGIQNAGMLTVTNSSIVQNSAQAVLRRRGGNPTSYGGGIHSVEFATTLLQNTIVATNTVANGAVQNDLAVFDPVDAASSNNLIGVDTSVIGISNGVNGNQIGTLAIPLDPMVGGLNANGGPTETHALLPGSPALDTGGTAACPMVDQRGSGRNDGACDIGAYESALADILVTTAVDETISNGLCSLREAIENSNDDAQTNSDCAAGFSLDRIEFDPLIFSSPQTITLSNGEMRILDSTQIVGPGAQLLTIDAGGLSRIFHLADPADPTNMELATINTISGMTLTDGASVSPDPGGRGGAIRSVATLSLDDMHINASTSSPDGGGLWIRFGDLTLSNSTISGNTASIKGGGLYLRQNTSTIVNSTISGNTASNASPGAGGGGIFIDSGALVVNNSTVTANSHVASAGIRSNSSVNASIRNTIVAGNLPGPDTFGNFDVDYSLIEDTGTSTINGGNNIIGQNPQLGTLQVNGGTTPTHLLLEGSPAIDAGENSSCESTDQNGVPRPAHGICDIGAVESLTVDIFSDEFEGI